MRKSKTMMRMLFMRSVSIWGVIILTLGCIDKVESLVSQGKSSSSVHIVNADAVHHRNPIGESVVSEPQGESERLRMPSPPLSNKGPSILISPRGRFGYNFQTEIADNPMKKLTSSHCEDGKIIPTPSVMEDAFEKPDWNDLFMQSVKRAVVVQPVSLSSGDNNANKRIFRIQRIIPKSHDYESSIVTNDVEDPPPHEQVAKMARFIVRNSNWTSMATISSRNPIVSYPFANVFSVSDGPFRRVSTGVPYMYLTPLEISVQDLEVDSRASLTMSLAQGNYCRAKSYDPEDPRCAHVILTGSIVEINNATEEAKFAREAMFSRHPEMPDWPQDHGWFFAKMNISNILVLDYFGGAKTVTPQDYFNAD